MRAHRIPNLSRDLPISIVLLIMAVAAAVLPDAIAVVVSLTSIAALMLIRFTWLNAAIPRRRAFRWGDGTQRERITRGRGLLAALAA